MDKEPLWLGLVIYFVILPILSVLLRILLGGWSIEVRDRKLKLSADPRKNFIAWAFLIALAGFGVVIFGYKWLMDAKLVPASDMHVLSNILVFFCAVIAIALPVISRIRRKRR